MKSTVEPLEGNKVKISVEIEEAEFEKAVDAAYKKIAREVRLPGFRPGKAPRKLLEQHIGTETARKEALHDALPDYYEQAVTESELDVIASPEIDIREGEQQGPVAFDAVVEVRPLPNIAGYENLRATVPGFVVTDDEINSQIDRLRGQFADLTPVGRAAQDGDHVVIDLKGTRGSEDDEALSAEDFDYEVGSGNVLSELDDNLRGAKAGDILNFDAQLPDETHANFRVLIKEVKQKNLPEVTDEWASDVSEFETVEELRSDLAKRIGEVKKLQSQMALRDSALDALVGLVDGDVPEVLIEEEMRRRLQDLAYRLQAQGANLVEYLQATGKDQDEFQNDLRAGAEDAVRADLGLRAVADRQGFTASEEEVEAEIARLAEQLDRKPKEVRRQLERVGQLPAVRSDIKKTKALEWLIEAVEVVDENGNPIDRAELKPEPSPAEIVESFNK